MRCKDHPTYRAIRPPRVACDACWWMYRSKHKVILSEDREIVEEACRVFIDTLGRDLTILLDYEYETENVWPDVFDAMHRVVMHIKGKD